ncbi:trichohyalin-like [Balamuthia mandrillaris]
MRRWKEVWGQASRGWNRKFNQYAQAAELHLNRAWYELDRKWNDFLYGKRKVEAVKVPFMITKEMKAQLAGLGYESSEVKAMTPAEAYDLIQNNTKASDRPKPQPKAEKKKEDETPLPSTINLSSSAASSSSSASPFDSVDDWNRFFLFALSCSKERSLRRPFLSLASSLSIIENARRQRIPPSSVAASSSSASPSLSSHTSPASPSSSSSAAVSIPSSSSSSSPFTSSSSSSAPVVVASTSSSSSSSQS